MGSPCFTPVTVEKVGGDVVVFDSCIKAFEGRRERATMLMRWGG